MGKQDKTFADEPPTHTEPPTTAPADTPEPSVPTDVDAMRLAASLLLTWAVDDSSIATTDVKYRLIVEHRVAPKYSSCGDLPAWLYYRLGVRAPFVNRTEYGAAQTEMDQQR